MDGLFTALCRNCDARACKKIVEKHFYDKRINATYGIRTLAQDEKKFSMLLSILMLLTAFGCSRQKEKEESLLMKNLNAAAIINNQDKVISSPTFTIDKSVKVTSDMFEFELLFSDGMMFQANAVVRLWGECAQDCGIAAEVGGIIRNALDKALSNKCMQDSVYNSRSILI